MVKYKRWRTIELEAEFKFSALKTEIFIFGGEVRKVHCPSYCEYCLRAHTAKSVPEDFIICVKNEHQSQLVKELSNFLLSKQRRGHSSRAWMKWATKRCDQHEQVEMLLAWNMFAPIGAYKMDLTDARNVGQYLRHEVERGTDERRRDYCG
jgi:hypothetical protein